MFCSKIGFVSVIAILLFVASIAAQKRIYISPDDHTDYYWTADEETYRQSFLTMIDYYLNKMDETEGNPSDQQMRWNCDGSLWMWEYERNRTPAQFARMMSRVRDGHMSVALNPLVLVQGGAPAESAPARKAISGHSIPTAAPGRISLHTVGHRPGRGRPWLDRAARSCWLVA